MTINDGRPPECCGRCPETKSGKIDCTCKDNPRCSKASEYTITYAIHRKRPEDENSEEIGFGSSGSWSKPEECVHMVNSDIQNYGWETSRGHPDPSEIKKEVEGI